MSKSMRDEMPSVAGFIDVLRESFGKEMVDAQIKKGLKGQPDCFYAIENGHELGTPFTPAKATIGWDARGVAYEVQKEGDQ